MQLKILLPILFAFTLMASAAPTIPDTEEVNDPKADTDPKAAKDSQDAKDPKEAKDPKDNGKDEVTSTFVPVTSSAVPTTSTDTDPSDDDVTVHIAYFGGGGKCEWCIWPVSILTA